MSEGYPVSRRLFVRLSSGAVAAGVAAATMPLPKAAGAPRGGACDPLNTPPSFMGTVPSPEDVLGFPIGVDREVTSDEIVTYVNAVGGRQQPGDRCGTPATVRAGSPHPLRDRRRPRQRHPGG